MSFTRRHPQPFGKYLLLDRINIGGMAEVWRGKVFGAGGFERLMAVKRILPNIAEDVEFISMFIDEAKITVQLAHSNIAQIYELNRIGNSYYIAMEYISGKDVRAIFDRCRASAQPAPVPLTCYLMARMCEGLDYAHRKKDGLGREMNIVHRDVSPQNVLVSYEGEVKVIDFGIAWAASKATQTQAGTLKGKFGYMSPEQIRGSTIDRRTDIFAAGIILQEMLTGERLFVGDSDFAVLEKVRTMDIPLPSTINPLVPPALDQVVMRALSRDLLNRYQYASELADDLQRFLLSSESIFSRKDLSAYMKATFAEEVEEEKRRLQEYADIRPMEGMEVVEEMGFPALASPGSFLSVSEPGSVEAPPRVEPLASTAVMGPRRSSRHAEATAATEEARRALSLTGLPKLTAAAPLLTNFAEEGRAAHPLSDGATLVRPPEAPMPVPVLVPSLERVPDLPRPVAPPQDSRVPTGSPSPKGHNLLQRGQHRFRLFLGAATLVVLMCVTALIIAFKPPPTGLLLVDVPPELRGKVRVNVNGEEILEADGSLPKVWPLPRKVPAGVAVVVVAADGYQSFTELVPVKKGQEVSSVKARLQRESRPAALTLIVVPPEAQVRVNGTALTENLGGTYQAKVDTGMETLIEAMAPGYHPYRQTLPAGAEESVSLKLELVPIEFMVVVSSVPEGAQVWVDGERKGETPTNMMLTRASTEVVLQKKCFRTVSLPLKLPEDPNEVVSLNATLRRQGNCR